MNGPWKEGRVGGASLCYASLNAATLAIVAANHAAVGIRGTIAGISASDSGSASADTLAVVAARHWDLAILDAPQALSISEQRRALTAIDSKTSRGCVRFHTDGNVPWPDDLLYKAQMAAETAETDETTWTQTLPPPVLLATYGPHDRPDVLICHRSVATVEGLMASIEQVMATNRWSIWLVDQPTFDQLSPEGHQQLLSTLGNHHARIWCAPMRDIRAWMRQTGAT